MSDHIFEGYGFEEKLCTKHGEWLPLTEFNKDSSKRDGLKSYCRQCQAAMDKRYSPRQSVTMESDYSLTIGKNDIPLAEIWGEGLAKIVEPSTKEHYETVVFVSDLHVPYHDKEVIEATLELIRDIQPHRVVINGDVNDFFQLSRFNKAFERLDLLQQELDMGFQIRKAFREAAPNAVFDETVGNHDERLITSVASQAPALKSLDALKPQNLLGLNELNINHHPRNGFRLREDFLVEHGQVVRKDAGASAKSRLDATLISGIMGHTHRLGTAARSGYKELRWFEQGCLCKRNADYVIGETNWQQGIAVGTFSTKSTHFNVELVPTMGRGYIFGGRQYGNVSAEPNLFEPAHVNHFEEMEVIYPVTLTDQKFTKLST